MSQAAVQPETADYIEASLSYLVDTGVKPSSYSAGPGGLLRARTGEYADHVMKIHNGRPLKDDFTMDGEGFKFVDHPTKMVDFYDEEELRRVYYPEIEELVKLHTGGKRAFIFDHTVRNGDDATREARKVREPVRTVHNDYTEWSAPQRVRDMLPADEVDDLVLSQRRRVSCRYVGHEARCAG